MLLFNISLIQVLATANCFAFVPIFQSKEPFFVEGTNKSYRNTMIMLLATNFAIFAGEVLEIFKRKFSLEFNGASRIVTFFIATPLLVVTMIFTDNTNGKELVWLIWLKLSLSVTVF